MKNLRRLRSTWEIYRWPLVVNLIALAGILSALIGNELWDLFSWLSLGMIAVAISLSSTFRRCNPVE
ncbi:hypothetical protein [Oceanobacter mangrovi]|uniref:hypothetical protein n=1 Tax=Oceanobacter mangrovi TaxID=2862510 RepID=UPI001C8D2C26|nr:hypothetical protein [Oceanobacter mangrovi]